MNASPTEIVRVAAQLVNRGARLDMSALAADLGISRTTLFRRVGNREDLLGEALWLLSDRTMRGADRAWRTAHGDAVRDPGGGLRCLWIMARYRSAIAGHEGMRLLLAEEPVTAIRVLTDPGGRVQPRVIAAYTDLLDRDVDAGGFEPAVDVKTLAYAIVRLGETFLYSDVLASRSPDLAALGTLVGRLVDQGL
ncbi:QsdR family transcriptional regulator [Actinokineospora soli]|uniref:QsdR family transcriptional regulator n=1 Tax=Actinokineospora soli TaxID=1048753 RepID=A0ABW2TRS8_9PSEU